MSDDASPSEDDNDLSYFENKSGLAEDMKFLASMPELCDITFLVGETREPVCAVKAVLAARSRIFHKMLYSAGPGFRLSQHGAGSSSPKDSTRRKDFRESTRLKYFLKRSSEPILHVPYQQPPMPTHQTIIVEEFEPDVFRQLIEYIHTGCVTLQARTLLGLVNAADYYGLDELRKACMGFVQCCINVDTVCALLASAERYIQYKCTKSLIQKVLEYVDLHGNEVLSLGSFAMLPQHVVCLILSREELRADELVKFHAALHWSQHFCENEPNAELRDTFFTFLEYIEFYKIPASILMREVHPLGVIPDHVIMNALAFQADPSSVDMQQIETPNRFRRHTLTGASLMALKEAQPIVRAGMNPLLAGALSHNVAGAAAMLADKEGGSPQKSESVSSGSVEKGIVQRSAKSLRNKFYRRSKTVIES